MAEEEVVLDAIDKDEETKNDSEKQQSENQKTFLIKSSLSENEITSIFYAKCEDYSITPIKQLLDRFVMNHSKNSFLKVFQMNSASLGPKAADVVAAIVLDHPHIKVLSLKGNSIGDIGALSIADLLLQTTSLISVDVASNSIKDEGAKALFNAMQSNNSVTQLTIGSSSGLSRNSLGLESAKELARMLQKNKVLSELDISMSEVTSDLTSLITVGLKQNNTLQVLNIGNNNITSKGCKKLLQSLINAQLVSLNISSNQIKDDVAPEFIKYITKNKHIKNINLSGNLLTKAFTRTIAQPLASQCLLESINFSHNPILGAGVEELGPALALNTSITYLDLSMCQIDVVGFTAFCKKLEDNTSLTYLSLSHNPIGDIGAKALGPVLRNHKTLKQIELELCEITDEGGDVLIPELAHSPVLERINLKNNLIRNSKLLTQVVIDNPKLIDVNVEFNDIDFKYFNQIMKIVKENYRKWIENRKDKIKEEVDQTADIEMRLTNTRSMIVEERQNIKQLKIDVANLKKEAADAKVSKDTTLSNLQDNLDKISKEQTMKQNDYSEMNHTLTMQKEELEGTVSFLTKDKETKQETFKRDTGALAQTENKILDKKQDIYSKNQALINEIMDARQRYNDAKALFEEAYNESHVFITKTEQPLKDPGSKLHSQVTTTRKKAGTKKKGLSKTTPKPAAGDIK